ncbi:carbohydrate sulfotransferase 15-like [Mizuhopecten yessoensis]|uniref:carbohydrate sulfotransferase 15-like n=1 Tax=Mizuhopecten yessoensis TaxID=6573 RepID=UPI000B45ECB3|nr:carbohydrate sulfotransferase 15-like [Mizuhopecten yessoensis]
MDKYLCKDKQPQSFTEYIDYFNPAAEILQEANGTKRRRFITGEGSQSTLWDHTWWWWYTKNRNDEEPRLLNAHIIRHILPDVKLLVILRNPVDRLYSDYLYFSPNEKKSAKSFHNKVTRSIKDFNKCLTKKSLRHCVYTGFTAEERLFIGLYAVYLKDWMNIYPRKQLLVLSLDEYSTNPSMAMSKIFKFLDLRDIGKVGTRTVHYNERRPSSRAVGQMLNKTRHILEQFYKPFNKELSLLMNDTRFLWQT